MCMNKQFGRTVKLFLTRVKSSSVLFALIVSMIVGFILLAVISLSYINRYHVSLPFYQLKHGSHVNSAIRLVLSNSLVVPEDLMHSFSLFNGTDDTVKVQMKEWGFFDYFIISAGSGQKRVIKSALTGRQFRKDDMMALMMPETGSSVSFAGQSEVKGDIYVPGGGVRYASIGGYPPPSGRIIDGSIFKSPPELPRVRERFLKLEYDLFVEKILNGHEVMDYYTSFRDSLLRSFHEPVVVLYSNEQIHLRDCYLKGNIIILSEHSVILHPSAILEDIMVLAPEILTHEMFSGTVQLIAKNYLELSEKTRLNYPSAIAVINASPKEQGSILINALCTVSGLVYYYSGNPDLTGYDVDVSIKEGAEVTGTVYCNRKSEITGRIHGELITQGLIFKQGFSVYRNYLYNGSIDRPALPEDFAGAELFENNEPQRIAKWLY